MNVFKPLLFAAMAAVVLSGCEQPKQSESASPSSSESTTQAAAEPLMEKARMHFEALPQSAPSLEGNPMSAERLELGKQLYFEPRLSASQFISCNSCHNLGLGGADLQKTSVGHGWQTGPRNAPTVLNAVFASHQFWDGREPDLEAQAKGPVQAGVEMANKPEQVVKVLKSMPDYVEAFKAAFPNEKDPVSFDNMAKAIALFESTLVTSSPFDDYLKGNATALSHEEKAGLELFMDKGCASCHNGVAVGGKGFFKFGLVASPGEKHLPAGDTGRMKATGKEEDKYFFRTPILRNIADTAPYFHTGSAQTLSEAIDVMAKSQLGLELSETEVSQIAAFLGSLSGKVEVDYPNLPASTDGTPTPSLVVAKGH